MHNSKTAATQTIYIDEILPLHQQIEVPDREDPEISSLCTIQNKLKLKLKILQQRQ